MHAFDTVINVNPAQKPAGALDPEVARVAIRSRVYKQGRAIARKESGRMLRRIFGPLSTNSRIGITLLAVRYAFSAWMLAEGVMMILAGGVSLLPVGMILAAVVAAFGIGTRMLLSAGAVASGYVACHALSAGMGMEIEGFMALAMGLIAYVGPGKYSIDAILRRNIFRSLCRRQTRRLLDNRFSYRAYEFAHSIG